MDSFVKNHILFFWFNLWWIDTEKETIPRFVGSNNDATLLPLLVNGAVIVEKVSKAVAKVIHQKYFKHIREATNSSYEKLKEIT